MIENLYRKIIIDLTKRYIRSKNKNKKWVAGKDLVHYAGPFFDEQEYINMINTALNGWLVLGEEGNKFESKFPEYLGKHFGLLTNSGSSSNLLMLLALTSKRGMNLQKGTKVITPIAGFPTTINPIIQLGFKPIFVDIELDTLNLDLDQVEQACIDNPDAKIITFAHVLGNPPDMNRLMKIIKKYNLILLEDCCDALGSTYDGKYLGSFGTMASCSFYPAHHITMGEGGFVACNDSKTKRILLSFRDWGRGCYCTGKSNALPNGVCGKRFSNWLPSLPNEIFDHKYVYEEIGYNLKPIEIQAAIGNAQIQKLDQISKLRKRNHALIVDIFRQYEKYFHLPKATPKSDPNWFAVAFTVKDDAPFTRAEFCKYLESNKIQTRPYFAGNIMFQPAYAGYMSDEELSKYPIAKKITTNTFFLGCSPIVIEEQICYIKETVDKFLGGI
jgi:CDP-6-deoxy-D-xylo-4-hexulose-3-dehydrase